MKYQSAKNRNILLCVATAIITAVMCILSVLGAGTAKADNGHDHGPDPDEGGIYYFTDQYSAALHDELLTYDRAVECFYLPEHNFEWDDYYIDWLDNTYGLSDLLAGIKNSHVIFELRKRFKMPKRIKIEELNESDENNDGEGVNDILPDKLLYIFSTLKRNNCKIMLICNTSEELYFDYRDFLDYVDIHISIDFEYSFVSSIFNVTNQDCGSEQIYRCTFILDNTFCDWTKEIPDNQLLIKNEFFSRWIYPYLSSVYEDCFPESYATVEECNDAIRDVLSAYSIKVLCQVNGSMYYNIFGEENENTLFIDIANESSFDYVDNYHIYAIGTTNRGLYNTTDWLNGVDACEHLLNGDLKVYIYNGHRYTNITERDCYMTTPVSDSTIYSLVPDFLMDNDLSVYDNVLWGRCIVTHKFITYSEDGWMLPLDTPYVVAGWQLY